MRIEARWLVLVGVGVFILIAVSYALGLKRGEERSPPPVATAPAAPAPAPAKAAGAAVAGSPAQDAGERGATLPPGHPVSRPSATADAAGSGRLPAGSALPAGHAPIPPAGAAGTVRNDITFTHFRVGNRNIKTMLAEEGVMWVGTSGGVIRYDTESDDYRVFDVRSGLLSNGVFHLSRLGGRLAVGTYGGDRKSVV